jgi:hypothetical protein
VQNFVQRSLGHVLHDKAQIRRFHVRR